MVDSAQMEKFEYEKSNQTYLGNNIYNLIIPELIMIITIITSLIILITIIIINLLAKLD